MAMKMKHIYIDTSFYESKSRHMVAKEESFASLSFDAVFQKNNLCVR